MPQWVALDIIDISEKRDSLVDKVKTLLSSNEEIETINGEIYDDFHFTESDNSWNVSFRTSGTILNKEELYKIVERKER